MDTVYKKLSKVRKPRVHISYEVETNGATEKKELPFIVGVMGDYSGNNPTVSKKSLKDRKFIQVDPDNFDEVMGKIGPGVSMKVKNTLADDDSEIKIDLAFKSMSDFEPQNIAKQVEPLRKLLETRQKLTELLSKADRSENLESLLENVLQDNESLKNIANELQEKQPEQNSDETKEDK